MKRIALLFVILCGFIIPVKGQDLINQKWVKYHIERLDGSRIISRTNIFDARISYHFLESGEVAVETDFRKDTLKYSITDSLLEIGPFLTMQIKELTDSLLILVDLSEGHTYPDKINKIFFTTKENHTGKLLSNNQISFVNDSTVVSNRYLLPVYKNGGLEKYFYDAFYQDIPDELEIISSFIISPAGEISKIEILGDGENSNKEVEKRISDLLSETNYRWQVPEELPEYYFKVNLTIKFLGSFMGFYYNDHIESNNYSNLSSGDQRKAHSYFERGNRLLQRNRLERAINNYSKCIDIDEIFLDAYYNRATANKLLGNIEESCRDWKFLYELGQTEGTRLFYKYCKEN